MSPPPYPPKKYTLASPRSRNGSKILDFVAAVAVDGPLIEEDGRAGAGVEAVVSYRLHERGRGRKLLFGANLLRAD